ncbi:hypothetical protein VI08_05235 [Luteibacter yeojuensis]|uniref:Antitoxin Xre/MbcA/ParS-like toxin-binding domain-containing protein n=2 Tax=Luteibacter yeojuensis TaxID=345309 RepID=A0A0F3L1N0_9GAMM|nr:hypothetical protein VI08_05235 [Luteibacter yeojuensis]
MDMLAVLDQASRIDPDRGRVYRWYADDPIAGLGDRTAADLVRAGETSRLLALLREIEAAERSARHVRGK